MSDTPDTEPTPIVVPASPVPDQFASAFRALLIAFGAYGTGKGWFNHELFAAAVPVIMIGWPFVWAQLKARSSHAKQVTMARELPNSIAQVQKP